MPPTPIHSLDEKAHFHFRPFVYGMIFGEIAVSFIELGMQPPAIRGGLLLQQAQAIQVLVHAPWLLIPGAFVVIVILAFNFVGDGPRDAADPYTTV